MEEELGSLTEKVEDMTASHKVHEERCRNDDVITTNKMIAMNNKVLEIRQLVGVNALSKGLASFKIINDLKRNSIIDSTGFMVLNHDQKPEDRIIEEGNETPMSRDDIKRNKNNTKSNSKKGRNQSPRRKLTAPKLQGWEKREQKRKQSLKAKGDDQPENLKQMNETLEGGAEQESISEEGERARNSSVGSDTFEEPMVERPRAARTKTRNRSVSPRKRTRSPTKKIDEIKRRMSINPTHFIEDLNEEDDERMDISSPEN